MNQNFRHGAIGFNLDVHLPLLQACMQAGSNQPYWDRTDCYIVRQDLQNPKFAEELRQIRTQFGLLSE